MNEIKSGYIPTVLYDKNENIEKYAETVINYLTLNLENIINYGEYENSANNKLKNLKNKNELKSNEEDESSFNLLKDSMNIKNKKEEKENYNKLIYNKINDLSNLISEINLENSEISKLLWFNQGSTKIYYYDLIKDDQIWKDLI